jgi:phosphatidylserine decarboxylase
MINILEKLAAGLQHYLPQHFLSGLVYRFMRIETGWFKDFQIRLISTLVGVNWAEAAARNPEDYRHFNAFFTRELREGARPAEAEEEALVSPCDGRISELGSIDGDSIFQAKGHQYSLQTLLANDPDCEQWSNGFFYTIYLSPRDYHRVHMPLEGTLKRMTHVPGRLFSVAPYTVRQIPSLFARNERVISVFDTAVGPVAQVLVGAMLVSSMETTWAGEITPSKSTTVRVNEYTGNEVRLARGDEMGRFNMGSTVILILPAGVMEKTENLSAGDALKLGQRLASLKGQAI